MRTKYVGGVYQGRVVTFPTPASHSRSMPYVLLIENNEVFYLHRDGRKTLAKPWTVKQVNQWVKSGSYALFPGNPFTDHQPAVGCKTTSLRGNPPSVTPYGGCP